MSNEDIDESDPRDTPARRYRRVSSILSDGCGIDGLRVLLPPPPDRSNPLLLIPFDSELFPTEYNDRWPEWRVRAGHSVIRQHWRYSKEFQIAAIGTALGLRNIVTIPILAAKYGQGTFIGAFIVVEFLIGFPLLFLELAIGQYSAKDPVRVLSLVPIAEGLCFAIMIIAALAVVSMNVYLSYTFYIMYFLFCNMEVKPSFSWPLPWNQCHLTSKQAKHLVTCGHVRPVLENNTDFLCIAHFYHNVVMGLHEECAFSNNITTPRWPLVICLLAACVFTFMFILNGIRTMGRTVVVVVPVICVIMLVCLVVTSLQDGGIDGIVFVLKPDWKYVYDFEMWLMVFLCVVDSLSLGSGAMVAIGSYASFHSATHCHAFFVCLADVTFSLMTVCMVSGAMGIKAHEYRVKISDLISPTPQDSLLNSLMFTTTFLKNSWCPQLMTILIFMVSLWVGETFKFGTLLVFLRPIYETYPCLRKRKPIANFIVIMLLFFLAIPFLQTSGLANHITDKGPMRWLPAFVTAMFVASFVFGYGLTRLRQDMDFMLHSLPNKFFCSVWIFVPFLFLVLMTSALALDKYEHDSWQPWVMFIVITLPIPITALWKVYKYHRKGDLRLALQPSDDKNWSRANINRTKTSMTLGMRIPATTSLRTRPTKDDAERHVSFGEDQIFLPSEDSDSSDFSSAVSYIESSDFGFVSLPDDSQQSINESLIPFQKYSTLRDDLSNESSRDNTTSELSLQSQTGDSSKRPSLSMEPPLHFQLRRGNSSSPLSQDDTIPHLPFQSPNVIRLLNSNQVPSDTSLPIQSEDDVQKTKSKPANTVPSQIQNLTYPSTDNLEHTVSSNTEHIPHSSPSNLDHKVSSHTQNLAHPSETNLDHKVSSHTQNLVQPPETNLDHKVSSHTQNLANPSETNLDHKVSSHTQNLVHPSETNLDHKVSSHTQNLAHPSETNLDHKVSSHTQNLANPSQSNLPHTILSNTQHSAHPSPSNEDHSPNNTSQSQHRAHSSK